MTKKWRRFIIAGPRNYHVFGSKIHKPEPAQPASLPKPIVAVDPAVEKIQAEQRAKELFDENKFENETNMVRRYDSIQAVLETEVTGVSCDVVEHYTQLLTKAQNKLKVSMEQAKILFDRHQFYDESDVIRRYQKIQAAIDKIDIIEDLAEGAHYAQLLSSAELVAREAANREREMRESVLEKAKIEAELGRQKVEAILEERRDLDKYEKLGAYLAAFPVIELLRKFRCLESIEYMVTTYPQLERTSNYTIPELKQKECEAFVKGATNAGYKMFALLYVKNYINGSQANILSRGIQQFELSGAELLSGGTRRLSFDFGNRENLSLPVIDNEKWSSEMLSDRLRLAFNPEAASAPLVSPHHSKVMFFSDNLQLNQVANYTRLNSISDEVRGGLRRYNSLK